MAKELTVPKSAEELEEQLGVAFRSGDIGQTAFITWEMMNRFPDKAGVARVYAKKILRDPEIAGLTVEAIRNNVKTAVAEKNNDEAVQLAALGLLKFPADRSLTLRFLDGLDKQKRLDLAVHALDSLGEPAGDDVTLLNAAAALAHRQGDHQRAYKLFSHLHSIAPDNEQIVTNLSAAQVGLKKFDEAVSLLEFFVADAKEPKEFVRRLINIYHVHYGDATTHLKTLDDRFFRSCDSIKNARVHADVCTFLQDFEQVERGLEACQSFKYNPVVKFEISEAQLTLGKFEEALKNYKVRFEAFPHLLYCEPEGKPYEGQILDEESLFVWSEQGLGDELLFACLFEELDKRVKNVTVAMDPRTIPPVAKKYPHWRFINRHQLEDDTPVTDFACPSGDLFILFFPELLSARKSFREPLITPDEARLRSIQKILGQKIKPRVGICWRGGSGVNGSIRSMDLPTFMAGLPSESDLSITSLQYDGEHEQEVIDHGDRRVALSGLNNRDDLEGVFCLLSQCDAVFTVDNAVAHFSSLMGLPTFVLIPAGQTQFRWKNPDLKQMFFPHAVLCRQTVPGDWGMAVEQGWSAVLNHLGLEAA